jgi:hypothetical protein
MGRPKNSPETQRDNLLQVRLTAIEKVGLEGRAASVGLSVSEFVRRRALGVPMPPQAADRATRDKLATALLRIGVNLNQITKHMNAGRHAPPELGGVLATVNACLNTLMADE